LLAAIAGRADVAVVLVTHNVAAARQLADRVVYLDRQVRAWGSPQEVLARDFGRGAFAGHDHEAPTGLCCEDEG
jgi:ABC-type Mn2+/Zn2+ transport system ATPase subunit